MIMITREGAKKIKSDFVNMGQTYNGHEITSMWNMMCDQLFDEIDQMRDGNNFKQDIPETTMPIIHEAVGEEYMQEMC